MVEDTYAKLSLGADPLESLAACQRGFYKKKGTNSSPIEILFGSTTKRLGLGNEMVCLQIFPGHSLWASESLQDIQRQRKFITGAFLQSTGTNAGFNLTDQKWVLN